MEARVHLSQTMKEKSVAGHRIVDAWRGQRDAVRGTEDRDQNCDRNQLRRAGTNNRSHSSGGDAVSLRCFCWAECSDICQLANR